MQVHDFVEVLGLLRSCMSCQGADFIDLLIELPAQSSSSRLATCLRLKGLGFIGLKQKLSFAEPLPVDMQTRPHNIGVWMATLVVRQVQSCDARSQAAEAGLTSPLASLSPRKCAMHMEELSEVAHKQITIVSQCLTAI